MVGWKAGRESWGQTGRSLISIRHRKAGERSVCPRFFPSRLSRTPRKMDESAAPLTSNYAQDTVGSLHRPRLFLASLI